MAARPLSGRLRNGADGPEHQFADRAPVLRTGIAPGLEVARDEESAGGPSSRADAITSSRISIAAWSRAAGVMI